MEACTDRTDRKPRYTSNQPALIFAQMFTDEFLMFCVSLDFSICPAMTATGQQVEVSTNEISGKTSLHGLTVFHFSNVAILS